MLYQKGNEKHYLQDNGICRVSVANGYCHSFDLFVAVLSFLYGYIVCGRFLF